MDLLAINSLIFHLVVRGHWWLLAMTFPFEIPISFTLPSCLFQGNFQGNSPFENLELLHKRKSTPPDMHRRIIPVSIRGSLIRPQIQPAIYKLVYKFDLAQNLAPLTFPIRLYLLHYWFCLWFPWPSTSSLLIVSSTQLYLLYLSQQRCHSLLLEIFPLQRIQTQLLPGC